MILNLRATAALPFAALVLVSLQSMPVQSQTATPATWKLVPDLTIGSIDDTEYSLTRVGGIAIGNDGTIYVSQPLDRQIVMFDPEGRILGRIGRQGGGPGEFESLGAPRWRADTLVIPDFRLQRMTFFSVDGRLLGSERIVSPPSDNGWFLPTVPTALLADGSAVVRPRYASRLQFEGLTRTPLFRINRAGDVLDTLAWLEVGHSSLALQHGSGAFFTGQPLPDDPLWRVAIDGNSMVFVERSAAVRRTAAHFTVTKINATGDTIYSRFHEYDPIPVSSGFIDSVIDAVSERASRRTFPNRREAIRAIRNALYQPDYLPPVTDVVMGRDATLWIRREVVPGDSIAWNVLDELGNMMGLLTLPKRLRVRQAQRDFVWAVALDEFDVPYVVRYRVEN